MVLYWAGRPPQSTQRNYSPTTECPLPRTLVVMQKHGQIWKAQQKPPVALSSSPDQPFSTVTQRFRQSLLSTGCCFFHFITYFYPTTFIWHLPHLSVVTRYFYISRINAWKKKMCIHIHCWFMSFYVSGFPLYFRWWSVVCCVLHVGTADGN